MPWSNTKSDVRLGCMRLFGAIWHEGEAITEQNKLKRKLPWMGTRDFEFLMYSFTIHFGAPQRLDQYPFFSSLSCHTITVSLNKTWRHQDWSTVPPRNHACVSVFPKKNINKSTVAASTSFLFGFCCLCSSFCWASRENHPLHTASKDLGLAFI